MHPTSRWKIFYLSHLSKPVSDRTIYRAIVREKSRRILELNIAEGRRALSLIDAAARFTSRSDIEYIGMDQFEGRSEADGPGLSLLNAHRTLSRSGARIKLIPGDPLRNLARAANDLGQVDVLIVSHPAEADRLNKVWYFVPRLLHAKTMIFIENVQTSGKKTIQTVTQREIEQWAAKAIRWRAA